MQDFVLPALFSGIPLYAVWVFMTPILTLMFTKKGVGPGRARPMLASGIILTIISVSSVKFDSPDAMARLAGIFVVAPILAAITYYVLERWDKYKRDSSRPD